MGLESATYIEDLVSTNPTASDNVSQGDDHLRLIKAVLQSQFTSLGSAAVIRTAGQLNAVPIQIIEQKLIGNANGTGTITVSANRPVITAGNRLFSGTQAITPTVIGSTIRCSLMVPSYSLSSGAVTPVFSLNETGETNSRAVFTGCVNGTTGVGGSDWFFYDFTTTSTSTLTFDWRFGGSTASTMDIGGAGGGATVYWNGTAETIALFTEFIDIV